MSKKLRFIQNVVAFSEYMNFNAFLSLIESNEARCTIQLTSFRFNNTNNEEKGKPFYMLILDQNASSYFLRINLIFYEAFRALLARRGILRCDRSWVSAKVLPDLRLKQSHKEATFLKQTWYNAYPRTSEPTLNHKQPKKEKICVTPYAM